MKLNISTHTLTWSVTYTTGAVTAIVFNFNSHAHVERDTVHEFTRSGNIDFNSHAHVERDVCHSAASAVLIISTHTLTWSVTGMSLAKTAEDLTFPLTRSRGA